MVEVSVQSGERKGLMTDNQPIPNNGNLERRIGLRSAVLFNMLEMIGVGPFITLPLVIAAAGFRLSVWAWCWVLPLRWPMDWCGRSWGGISAGRRLVCVSAGDLWPERAGTG